MAGFAHSSRPTQKLSGDFWKFWLGQTISNLGSSFTGFALPLTVYKLTGSALNLAVSSAASMLPLLLFGLIIGAWVDRADRRRLMIRADLAHALVIASIPLLAALGRLSIGWIYAVAFISATLSLFFAFAQVTAVASLVTQDDLVTANGRIQASYSAVSAIGPLLAGLLVATLPVPALLLLDALAYCLSLAEEEQRAHSTPRRQCWLDRLEREHENQRAALRWLERQGDWERALELVSALSLGRAVSCQAFSAPLRHSFLRLPREDRL